jgi:hypothetical protein
MSPEAAPTPDESATTAVPLLAGRYQLLDKLGEGGMGAVFQARDTKLDRQVAVKLLPAGSVHDAEAVGRFRREARALAKLSHPGIIQAFDSGEDGNKHFLVMELVAGRSLAHHLAERGAVAPTRAADFAHQAALALHHAHRHGLVHRDVKPSNLLLAPNGRVKLLDLGLARFLQDQLGDAGLTRENAGLGTPDYVPPEQYRDAHHADPRADVYSLGCTLYHLIAGRVPFPGSSLSEKMKAHETREPPALEEVCPDVPGGLALVVRRMMAKRPTDRFQDMAQVAEALAPYVAASSASFRDIRDTATWAGAQLSTMRAPPRRMLLPWLVAGAAAALVLVAVGLVGLAAGWFRGGGTEVAQHGGPGPAPADTGREAVPAEAPKPAEPGDPDVLTVSQKPADGARFATITAALEAVQPGQTIRVLDDGVYHEALAIKGPRQHAGVTLEAVRGAVLEAETQHSLVLLVSGAPDVTVRGLRLRAKQAPQTTLVAVRGDCAGLRLERLELSSDGAGHANGIEFYGGGDPAADRSPVVIEGCTFRRLGVAASLTGEAPEAVARVAVRDSLFADCYIGAKVTGRAARVQVVGNRFVGLMMAATQFELLSPDAEGIVVANNTFSECAAAFRLWDGEVKGKGVRLQNNLLLGCPSPDMVFIDADNPRTPRGPGDGAAVAKAYDLGHNWREGQKPGPRAWVPADTKKGDVLTDKINGVNRDPKSPEFLRPDPKSPLATDGAGNADPSLPPYVGALPPEGAEPWDWDRAWRVPRDAQLLTVSKESGGGGQYRTINDALKDARPWATVRVLDAASYEERIHLNDRRKHEGLTLEAVKAATLFLPADASQLVTIEDVPHVRLSGFRCGEPGGSRDAGRAFIVVSGAVPGVALTRLEMTPKTPMRGVVVQNATAGAGPPLRIERCNILPACPLSNDGIGVAGNLESDPTRGVCVRANRIANCVRGINLRGTLRDIHVTGNVVRKCPGCALQVEDVAPASHGLVFANNTAFASGSGFRVWDNPPYEGPVAGQAEVANNLFFGSTNCDVAYILDQGAGKVEAPGDGKALLRLWRFHHNRRDFSGPMATMAIPAGADDARLRREELLSTAEDEPERVRPDKDSSLAAQGAGPPEHLPAYVGALPPEGTPAWDWDRTWRARVKKVEDRK